MASKIPVTLTVNGEERNAFISGRDTLLTVLRDQFELTATRRGCNQGVCGACTVEIDGESARSCLTLAATCEGAKITTVEGLMQGGELNPVQQAFANTGAVQCGFCTSGMMMTVNDFLQSNPHPTIEEARQAIAGNLCRCSGYKRIIDAILEAARLRSAREAAR